MKVLTRTKIPQYTPPARDTRIDSLIRQAYDDGFYNREISKSFQHEGRQIKISSLNRPFYYESRSVGVIDAMFNRPNRYE